MNTLAIRNGTRSGAGETAPLRSPFFGLQSSIVIPAFTLVELMVVVVIIGVLATIVTVSVTDYLVKGKQSAARAEIAQISNALA